MNRINLRWMTGIAAAAALASLGCGDKLLGISASISVTPTTLAFGSSAVGVPQQIVVSVSNTGSASLVINKIWVDQNPNNDLTVQDLLTTDCSNQPRSGGTTLSPGECARFTTVWAPTVAETAAGDVEVDSSDATNPSVHLPVTGNAASPLLQYCVLDSSGNVVQSQCSNLGVNPQVIPTVDFGTGLPGTASNVTVRLFNLGTAPLTFLPAPAIDTTQPNASIFSVAGSVPGGSLAPNATADLTLTATPTANGSFKGYLDLSTNDARAATPLPVPLQVTVAGFALCVNPSNGLSFGNVTIGQSQVLQITFTNCGSTPLTVDEFRLDPTPPTTTQFTITSGALPAVQSTLAIGAAFTLGVTYTPTAARADKASFDYQLAVGGDALMGSVPVTGTGVAGACGTAGAANPVANIAASYSTNPIGPFTNFTPSATPTPVIPLDYIKLSATGSTVTGAATYTWQLVSQPAGSTTSLSPTTGTQTTMETLVSGDYVVSLTVKDSTGCTDTASVTISVASQGAVHIELTWNTSCGDLDLHYANYAGTSTGSCVPGKSPSTPYDDCGYYNTSTSWGATLDHDELDGYGPENITQNTPADGTYEIWVYYYAWDSSGGGSTCGTVVPTVNVYFKGVLSQTYVLTNGFTVDQAWHAADITVSTTATQFASTAEATSPIGTARSSIGGPCTDGTDGTDRGMRKQDFLDSLK